jgi:hypothetical protein
VDGVEVEIVFVAGNEVVDGISSESGTLVVLVEMETCRLIISANLAISAPRAIIKALQKV